jgi:hypothetical protein
MLNSYLKITTRHAMTVRTHALFALMPKGAALEGLTGRAMKCRPNGPLAFRNVWKHGNKRMLHDLRNKHQLAYSRLNSASAALR